jgi:RNA polymerase sigma-70 factor (ECF subfamily)
MTSTQERRLLASARAGDARAIEQLLERHQGQLYRFSLRMCGDPEDAREVLQESLLAVARGIGAFRGEASLSSWLYAIARSFCVKQRRRMRVTERAQSLEHTALTDSAPAPDQQLADRELRAELESAIAALEPGYREVLLLRDVEGLRAAEVAEALQMTVPQVKSRLHRARAAVRQRLERLERPHRAPPAAECPDIVTLFSRYLEDEVSVALCEQMQAHIDGCARCRATCDALKHTLSVCHDLPTPEVPDAIQHAVRRELAKLTR